MRLMSILDKKCIETNLSGRTKKTIIKEIVDVLYVNKKIKEKKCIIEAVFKREEYMSTAIGHGVAIPHCKIRAVDEITLAIGKSRKGVNFEALDGKPVNLIFLLVAPDNRIEEEVKALAKISKLIKHDYFRKTLLKYNSARKIYEIIGKEDKKF